MIDTKLTELQVYEKFADIVVRSLHVDREKVTMDAHLMDDLGAESLDLIEITLEAESEFDIWLPEKSILDTAAEVFGPDILVQNGLLTPAGKQLLRSRMPLEGDQMFDGEVTVKALQSHFLRVRSWVALIERLREQTPAGCDACGGTLKADKGFRMKCSACDKEIMLRSGEEINRDWVKQYYDREYIPSTAVYIQEESRSASA